MRPEPVRPEPVRSICRVNGIDLSYVEWSASAAHPVVLMLHATGFHARCWDATVGALPEGLRVIAVDQRGHGQSTGKSPIDSWVQFAADCEALIEHLDLRDIVGVGHSMGGHCITLTALRRPAAFRNLVLIDPVLPEPAVANVDRFAGLAGPHEHPLTQRRNRWASWQQMFAAFENRFPYSVWQKRVLEDYCRHGLMPAPHGELQLACPPIVEASVYMRSKSARILDRLKELMLPVTILRAKYTPQEPGLRVDFTRSATWEGLASYFPNARDVYLPELTHFIVMQAPELVAQHIVAAVDAPVDPRN